MPARPEVTGRRRRVGVYEVDADAYSIAEFCERHRISVQMYYKLRQQRLTPVEFYVGARVLISKESAAAWRRDREAASAAAHTL